MIVTAFQLKGVAGGAQDFEEFVVAPGFEDIAVNLAAVDSFDGIFEQSQTGHEQANGFRRVQADPLKQLDASHVRQFLVGQDEVYGPVAEDGLGGFGGIRGVDFKVVGGQFGQGAEDGGIVVHHQK
jgi:hypothetical protein